MIFFFKQKTAYEIKECDWSSDVCSSDLPQYKDGMLFRQHEFGRASVWSESGATQWHFKDAAGIRDLLKQFTKEDLAASAQRILEDQVQNILYPDRKSTRLNSSHIPLSRMPSSA